MPPEKKKKFIEWVSFVTKTTGVSVVVMAGLVVGILKFSCTTMDEVLARRVDSCVIRIHPGLPPTMATIDSMRREYHSNDSTLLFIRSLLMVKSSNDDIIRARDLMERNRQFGLGR